MPSYSLPSPLIVIKTFIKKMYSTMPDGSTLPVHIMASLQVTLIAFGLGAIVGIPLGILMSWYKKVDIVVKPVFDFIRTIPPVSIIPIMIVLFGIGIKSKIAMIFFAAVIPCVINSYSGIKQTKPIHIWVASTFGATNLQILRTIAIPSALPMIFNGLKVSLAISWMCIVAAELLAATKGLGYMMQIGRTLCRADLVVVGLIAVSAIGASLFLIVRLLEKKYLRGEE